LLTLLGALGTEFYLAPAQRELIDLNAQIDAARSRVRIMKTALLLDEMFVMAGGLVFAVPADFVNNPVGANLIAELERRSFEHRHDGVRSFLAQLAVIGEVDFAAAEKVHEGLIDAEHRDFTLTTYRATNAFEADLATQTTKDAGEASMQALKLRPRRAEARAEAERRAVRLLVIGSIGTTFVFLATMATTRTRTPAPGGDEATRVLRLALAEARRRAAAGA